MATTLTGCADLEEEGYQHLQFDGSSDSNALEDESMGSIQARKEFEEPNNADLELRSARYGLDMQDDPSSNPCWPWPNGTCGMCSDNHSWLCTEDSHCRHGFCIYF